MKDARRGLLHHDYIQLLPYAFRTSMAEAEGICTCKLKCFFQLCMFREKSVAQFMVGSDLVLMGWCNERGWG